MLSDSILLCHIVYEHSVYIYIYVSVFYYRYYIRLRVHDFVTDLVLMWKVLVVPVCS